MKKTTSRITRAPIASNRVRAIAGQGFCFVPHRFLRDGFFAALNPEELLLYFILVLAGDRHGISFYHYDTLCSLLQMPVELFLTARNGLIGKDLIAFDGRRFQVLSLPSRPVRAQPKALEAADFELDDPATIRSIIRQSLLTDDKEQ